METYKIVKTTDGKNIGRVFSVPYVDKNIAHLTSDRRFWFDHIYRRGQFLYLECPNYKVILKRLD